MARRVKGEGSILKLKGCRFWYASYFNHNGKQIRVSTRTEVKQEALTILRKLTGDRDKGLAPVSDLRKIYYRDLRAGLLASYIERGNKSLYEKSDGNGGTEELVPGLKRLDEFFGFGPDNPGLPVIRLTTDAARQFAKTRKEAGAGNAVINRSLSCLRRMLRLAHQEGKIQTVPYIPLLKEPPARRGFLPREDFERLRGLLPGHLRPVVTFLYYCGCRLGETKAIEWPQVNLDARLITLHEEQTKTGEPRVIPIPSEVAMMLAEIEPKEGKVFDATNLRTEWAKACAAAGLGELTPMDNGRHRWVKYRGLIIHDLRRSALRNLVKAGVNEREAMRISGHSTRSVFDRYAIVTTKDLTEAMRRVELAALASGQAEMIRSKTGKKVPHGTRKLLRARSSSG